MLPDYYEYIVQKTRHEETIERLQRERQADAAVRAGRQTSLLESLRRTACRIGLPAVRTASCASS
jgi:hypothetical protein